MVYNQTTKVSTLFFVLLVTLTVFSWGVSIPASPSTTPSTRFVCDVTGVTSVAPNDDSTCTIAVANVGASTPESRNILEEYTYGGSEDDSLYAVVECSGGGFAFAGGTQSMGAGGWDFWLVRTDANGNHLWTQTYGGPLDEVCADLVECGGGGFALAGHTTSFGAGNEDFWLVHTDASGNLLWNETFGGAEDDVCHALIEYSGGGFVLVGYSESYTTWGDSDVWLVRTDSTGHQLWARDYGYGGDDCGYDIIERSDGRFTIVGMEFDTNINNNYDEQALYLSYGASGNYIGCRRYGGPSDDYFYSITECSNGDFVFAGYSYYAGGFDYWLMRVNEGGGHLWNKTYDGATRDFAHTVVECSLGGFAFCGYGTSWVGGEALLIRTDQYGNQLWNQSIGGAYEDFAYDMIELSGGDFALVGRFGTSAGQTDGSLVIVEDRPIWWDDPPRDAVAYYGWSFSYDLDASAWSGIDTWWLSTNYFSINQEGIITNATTLRMGGYGFYVYVNDSLGNVLSASISVSVQNPPIVFPNPIFIAIAFCIGTTALIFMGFYLWGRRRRRALDKQRYVRSTPRERRTRRPRPRAPTVKTVKAPAPDTPSTVRVVDPESYEGSLKCLDCGAPITGGATVCSECGFKQQRCIVCRNFMSHGDRQAQCPHCKQVAHRTHLLEWLKTRGTCPHCKRKLRRGEIV